MIEDNRLDRKNFLGIELGSTRIKACLIDDTFSPITSGSYAWDNKFKNGCWTYDIDDIHTGIQQCFADLRHNISKTNGTELCNINSIGISGMMHGYLVFDKNMKLLTPFRTWRNTITEPAAKKLSVLFNFNIPQRWSIAHLYQAILNDESHIHEIAHITTISGYIHYLLTGKHEIGVSEGSGMFPFEGSNYNEKMLDMFDELIKDKGFAWKIRDILPKVRPCSDCGTVLTETGARFLDLSGELQPGIPVCAPEGDAGTGMIATNSIKPKTGNISAGTSVFSLLVLEKPISGMYPEIDIVMTPDAFPVALIHSNNGCSELDAWVNIFCEFASMLGLDADKSTLYKLLYENALSGDADCGEIVSYNYLASEPVSGIKSGKPMYYRTQKSKLNLANFFRSQLYSAVAVLKIGMDMLKEKEGITASNFCAHGGLFKVPGVAQQLLANAIDTEISVFETAGEGGAWGMALLAAYSVNETSLPLCEWLDKQVFKNTKKVVLMPEKNESEGFDNYFKLYKSGLQAIDMF
ncbi:MAG: ATPase [Oscillospiraceae bacterium]|nr:ATPase [Oscillospiraceae bacterium]